MVGHIQLAQLAVDVLEPIGDRPHGGPPSKVSRRRATRPEYFPAATTRRFLPSTDRPLRGRPPACSLAPVVSTTASLNSRSGVAAPTSRSGRLMAIRLGSEAVAVPMTFRTGARGVSIAGPSGATRSPSAGGRIAAVADCLGNCRVESELILLQRNGRLFVFNRTGDDRLAKHRGGHVDRPQRGEHQQVAHQADHPRRGRPSNRWSTAPAQRRILPADSSREPRRSLPSPFD